MLDVHAISEERVEVDEIHSVEPGPVQRREDGLSRLVCCRPAGRRAALTAKLDRRNAPTHVGAFRISGYGRRNGLRLMVAAAVRARAQVEVRADQADVAHQVGAPGAAVALGAKEV